LIYIAFANYSHDYPNLRNVKIYRLFLYNIIKNYSPYRAVNTLLLGYKNRSVGEIIAVCSENRTKHVNALCGQIVEVSNVKYLAVNTVTIELSRVQHL